MSEAATRGERLVEAAFVGLGGRERLLQVTHLRVDLGLAPGDARLDGLARGGQARLGVLGDGARLPAGLRNGCRGASLGRFDRGLRFAFGREDPRDARFDRFGGGLFPRFHDLVPPGGAPSP